MEVCDNYKLKEMIDISDRKVLLWRRLVLQCRFMLLSVEIGSDGGSMRAIIVVMVQLLWWTLQYLAFNYKNDKRLDAIA